MKKTGLNIYILLLGLGFVVTALATQPEEPKRYQIEIIAFQQTSPTAGHQELWAPYPALPQTNKAIALIDNDEEEGDKIFQDFHLLPSPAWQLQRDAIKIGNNPRYRLLGHLAWQQAIPQGRYPQTVRIQLSDETDDDSLLPQPTWTLDGTLALRHNSSYITAKANLLLSLPSTDDSTPIPLLSVNKPQQHLYPLQQTQRIRPNELYYMDHPLYGLLILITELDTLSDSTAINA